MSCRRIGDLALDLHEPVLVPAAIECLALQDREHARQAGVRHAARGDREEVGGVVPDRELGVLLVGHERGTHALVLARGDVDALSGAAEAEHERARVALGGHYCLGDVVTIVTVAR